ncbi:MAG: response regulator [Nitrospirae bacterium]|nr:response regulator [Nitrospirota bacterium]
MLLSKLAITFRNMTIRKKLSALLLSAGSAAVLIACIIFYVMTMNHFRKSYEDGLASLAQVTARNCEASLAFQIPEDTDRVLDSLSANPSVKYAVVRDAGGKVFAAYGAYPKGYSGTDNLTDRSPEGYLRVRQNILMAGSVIGSLALYDDMREVSRVRFFAVSMMLVVVLISMAVFFVMISYMQRLIAEPILSLSSTARQISRQQDFSLRAEKQGDDEVGQLVDDFNSMIGHIEDRNLERQRTETERQKLEAQLLQAQKMEAIGHLAGGIAHDFNNMLQAIIGYASLLDMRIEQNSPLKSYVAEILNSSEKSADLTKQLLAFSRKQVISPKQIDLNQLIKGMEKMLVRLIGEDVEFETYLVNRELSVVVDPGQIGQVLMNLCTNARDAMPDGGHLSISTETVQLGEDYIAANIIEKPGLYALISVTDTGVGMDEETKQKIFDPFFTTKEVGKGTGLGLSIAYGIIKQHNGHISVYSELGKGTTFRIYLPLSEAMSKATEAAAATAPRGGKETVLVAEDNEEVRGLIRSVLEGFGYTVITAVDGEDALHQFRENEDRIKLVILDVIMPKKNGKEVYDEIIKTKPQMKVLFSSGYTADVISTKGVLEGKMDFISKPVTPHDLLIKIREILDRHA